VFIQDRESARRFLLEVWHKHKAGMMLESMEEIVAAVILQHPEYQGLLEDEERALASDYTPEAGKTNPFLHMGMHIAIREQLMTNRPPGILAIYNSRLRSFGDSHALEHRIMECLGEALWIAQRNNTLPDEGQYLDCLQKI
jgi:hypothetical protein